ncbi:unnamed protein product [Phaedon cochleariae]|uniref:Rho guanine nucleotide exchange factor n=1 Tax=Phaedon cochleariae TaxID=80249 RepID=A0A9N9SEN9_PHACE|nr:unnamed protein product [Phaedon cochleariae]
MSGGSSYSDTGSSVCQKSPKKPRRNVGDRVLITSHSKVYVNHDRGSDFACDYRSGVPREGVCDKDAMVSESLRSYKDLPKFKNRIFEDSLESQEVSFYIEDNTEDEAPEYENVENLDLTYDSFDSDDEFYDVNEVEFRNQVPNNPLPPIPLSETNGLNKLTQNIKRFKKNFSRDITKSLRRMSRKVSQTEDQTNVGQTVEEKPASIIYADAVQSEKKPEASVEKPNDGLLTRIRRSVSLSAVSVSNLTNYFENQNQRKSTFYLTGTIDIDGEDNTITNENDVIESPVPSNRKNRVIRPKLPPPPVPKNTNQNQTSNRKSLYSEAGLFKNKSNLQKHDKRASWYAEIGLYPKTIAVDIDIDDVNPIDNGAGMEENNTSQKITNSSSDAKNSKPRFSSLMEELNFKLNKNISREEVIHNIENESTYNYSVRSCNSSDSKRDDSSITYATNDLKFLEDEPLYQFYDAAVLGSNSSDYDNSDFEHDIYEDVEETNENYISSSLHNIPSPTSRNNFTFNRSLWCEIPEVIKSPVLSQLSSQQKKLQEAKFEIITSEASYLNSLNVLCDHFESRFKNCDVINEKEMEILFGKVREVRFSSKKIMYDLEKCWQQNILLDGICDIIQKHAEENFRVYIPYCENQVVLNGVLSQLKERPEFSEFLTQLESSISCHLLSLYSFLMLPMQRITRWPLLVDAILKRLSESDPEYLTCQYALATLNKIVSQCNEAAKRKEQQIELIRISESLEFPRSVPPVDIKNSERWLVKSGSVVCFRPRSDDTKMTLGKRFNKVPMDLFLFNDFFLVTKKRSENQYTVMHYCPRSMLELRSVDMFPTILKKEAQDKHLLYLSILENQDGKVIELLLSSDTETDKERWIEAISPPRSDDPDETLYECWDCPQVKAIHNYVCQQADELSLSKGDVINVLRKMSDGWYHGERLRDGQTGWFPANYTSEIVNPHVRARNLKQRYRLLTFSEKYLKS